MRILNLLVLRASIVAVALVFAFAHGEALADPLDGASGTAGLDGDPPTDGGPGGDGLSQTIVNGSQITVVGGNGGAGGIGGNATGFTRGGSGGNGGNGAGLFGNFLTGPEMSAGNGGDGGLGGSGQLISPTLGIPYLAPGATGNGGNGGTVLMSLTNTTLQTVRGGNGGRGQNGGNGGNAIVSATGPTIVFGGDGGAAEIGRTSGSGGSAYLSSTYPQATAQSGLAGSFWENGTPESSVGAAGANGDATVLVNQAANVDPSTTVSIVANDYYRPRSIGPGGAATVRAENISGMLDQVGAYAVNCLPSYLDINPNPDHLNGANASVELHAAKLIGTGIDYRYGPPERGAIEAHGGYPVQGPTDQPGNGGSAVVRSTIEELVFTSASELRQVASGAPGVLAATSPVNPGRGGDAVSELTINNATGYPYATVTSIANGGNDGSTATSTLRATAAQDIGGYAKAANGLYVTDHDFPARGDATASSTVNSTAGNAGAIAYAIGGATSTSANPRGNLSADAEAAAALNAVAYSVAAGRITPESGVHNSAHAAAYGASATAVALGRIYGGQSLADYREVNYASATATAVNQGAIPLITGDVTTSGGPAATAGLAASVGGVGVGGPYNAPLPITAYQDLHYSEGLFGLSGPTVANVTGLPTGLFVDQMRRASPLAGVGFSDPHSTIVASIVDATGFAFPFDSITDHAGHYSITLDPAQLDRRQDLKLFANASFFSGAQAPIDGVHFSVSSEGAIVDSRQIFTNSYYFLDLGDLASATGLVKLDFDIGWTGLRGGMSQVAVLALVPKPGDANGDGLATGADYTTWAANFGQSTTGGSAAGDFNHDGKVTGADYTIWAAAYAPQSVAPATALAVPEPATGGLLAMGLLFMLGARIRSRRAGRAS